MLLTCGSLLVRQMGRRVLQWIALMAVLWVIWELSKVMENGY